MSHEYSFGTHSARYDTDKKVLYLYIGEGEYSGEHNKEFERITEEVFEGQDSGRHVMIVLSTGEGMGSMTREARQQFKEQHKSGRRVADKHAIVGASPAVRVFVKILMKLTKSFDGAFFKTEEEALAWFREG